MGGDGKFPIDFGIDINTSVGSYTYRLSHSASVFVDITVVVVDNV
jgi:hypothetical protein